VNERDRIRAAILTEIDDLDPDGHMRALLEDQARGEGDPGIAGNSWWRAYCELSGMMRALTCIDNPGDDPVGQLAMDLQHSERENRRLAEEPRRIERTIREAARHQDDDSRALGMMDAADMIRDARTS
jgi:hypothetical protein